MKLVVCIILFTSLSIQAQSYFFIVKLDSSKWRIEERVPASKGTGGTIHFSDIADSNTIVSRYISLTEIKRAAVEQRIAEKEYQAFNQELKRVTGRDYEALLNEKIAGILPGNWNIVSQRLSKEGWESDTISVNIAKNLQISGGKIKGYVNVAKVDSIVLTGVFPEPEVMKIIDINKLEDNPLAGLKGPIIHSGNGKPKIVMTRTE